MLVRVTFLVVGIAIGIGGTYFFSLRMPRAIESGGEQMSAQQSAQSISGGNSTNTEHAVAVSIEPTADNTAELPTPQSTTSGLEPEYDSQLPSVYADMIGKPKPRRLKMAERHRLFLAEPRDESWATSMEVGISDYIATVANSEGFVPELVECRSRQCVIAGYTIEGNQEASLNLFKGLRDSGWWQGANRSSIKLDKVDGQWHTVLIFDRYGLDANSE